MDRMHRSHRVWSMLLLIVFRLIAAISNGDGEARGWTPPFSRWTTPSPVRRIPSTVQTTATIAKTLCDRHCCQCDFNNTLIKCKRSSTCWDFTMSRDSLPTEAKTITMTGFNRLKINKDSLGKLHQFQSLTIEHINGIEMEPYALALPLCESIKGYSSIVINASTISNLKRRTLTGGWKEIAIFNSTLDVTETESFYNTECLKKLTFEKNVIARMRSRTLADGSEAQYLSIKSNEIKSMESAFHLNVTDSAVISRNVIHEIQSEAFVLQSPRTFKFINNTVGNVYQNAFQFAAQERIDIISNIFERVSRHAFYQMQLTTLQAKIIIGSTIKTFDKGALDLNEAIDVTALQMVDIKLEQDCVCNLQVSVNSLFTNFIEHLHNLNTVVRDSVSCRVHNNRTEKAIAFILSCKTPKVAVISSITVTVILLLTAVVAVVIAIRQREKLRRASASESTNRVMRVYREVECRVEEEFVLPLETVNENGCAT